MGIRIDRALNPKISIGVALNLVAIYRADRDPSIVIDSEEFIADEGTIRGETDQDVCDSSREGVPKLVGT